MSADRDPIDELLASISDGETVDWERTPPARGPSDEARLAALKDIARIADFNRTLQAAGDDAGAPERWGDLLLLERIGSGGHADVHRAWDPRLERDVALKLLRHGGDGPALLEEGRAAARIRHPHVVAVHGIDRRDGRIGLWMELVRGVDLGREVAARGPLPPAGAARLGIEIGGALVAVHAAGLVHRDVKPANVVKDAEGRFVLADFGLGVRWDRASLAASGASGTPMYMAPELLHGGDASERSDVYALGALLWFALAGRHPFAGTSLDDLPRAVARGPEPRLAQVVPSVPAELVAVVERAMAPDPARRTARAHDVVEALRAWSAQGAGDPSRAAAGARPRVARLALGALVVAVAVAAFAAWQARRGADTSPAPAPVATAVPPGAVAPAAAPYAVEASLVRRDGDRAVRLVTGDRVRPGDRLSLEFRATRKAWVYVLNEDERGERYLLFPQPLFDTLNPLAADSAVVLPGTVRGQENAWTVTSAGGREHFLVVASPGPVAELEAELSRLPAPEPGRPIRYAAVPRATVERLRGVGGVVEIRGEAPVVDERPAGATAFDRFRALAPREENVRGVWIRQIALENPAR